MGLYEDYNIILINLDGFRRDKIDHCLTLKNLKKIVIIFLK